MRHFRIDVINVVPEAITSNIGSNYNRMPEWKLYKPFEELIKERIDSMNTLKSIPAEVFTKDTVAMVIKNNPPA
ncbi:hypothetical protein Pint_26686 [Pistacia integerrima]|uniref:Uncharacterized protein n=1 Tax=Pistacia integerrima TaxID=434235 RepID=A0ACC0YSR5_9ROSI|nr:hypothetical protein Pint_26686 [Pistacia integerrima]